MWSICSVTILYFSGGQCETQKNAKRQDDDENHKIRVRSCVGKKCGKLLVVLQNIGAIIGVFPPIIYAVFPGLIINELIQNRRIPYLILYVFCLLALPAILRLIKTFIDIRTSKLTKTFNMEITSDFYNHVMNMDYATVENPEIQNIKERASDTLVKVADVSTGMTTLISAVISLLLISSIISVLNPLVILLVILILIINSAVTKKVNYKNHIIGMELSKNDLLHDGTFIICSGSTTV